MKWAIDHKCKSNPNDPSEFELLVQQFNLRYTTVKKVCGILAALLGFTVLLGCLPVEILPVSLIRGCLLLVLVVFLLVMLIWRHFLAIMTRDLLKETFQINMSILPMDSASLIQEVD